jgi:hypothetical protein
MLYYPRLHRWLPLEAVQFHAASSTLAFSHPAQGSIPARRFEATVTHRCCHGVLTDNTATVHWSAAKHALFGIWSTPELGTYMAIGDVESPAGLSGTKFKRHPTAPWSLIQSVTLTDGQHARIVLDAVQAGRPGRIEPGLRGFAMTLNGNVMTGKELERDIPARLDRLPDGLPFG